MSSVRFTVLVPAYNEEVFIRRCLIETCQVMDEMANGDYEIIVIDDGSRDDTYAEAEQVARKSPQVELARCSENLGKGRALRRGFERARGELVFFLDADLDIHPNQLKVLYKNMREKGADVVIGTKHHHESRSGFPWHRRVISVGYMLLVRMLFDLPLQDTQTGIKLFRHEVLQRVYPRTLVGRFAFDLEMLVAAIRFGYHVIEAPVDVSFQRGGQGRIGVLGVLRTWWDTLDIFYRASFWKWLNPSFSVRVWLVILALGLVLAGVGLGHLLIKLTIPPYLESLFELLALHFIDRGLRNWIFFAVGTILVISALIKLNKYLLAAFASLDEGDLAGIMQRHVDSPSSRGGDELDE